MVEHQAPDHAEAAMIRIGVLSKVSQVPVKTLRYYDEIGLLKPAHVDGATGYRSYTVDQLPRLNLILALKDLGFSLAQIGRMADEEVTAEQIRGMLRMQRAEVEEQLAEDQLRLARVESRLRRLEQEGKMPDYEVIIKKAEPMRAAVLRDTIPNYGSVGILYDELFGALGRAGIAPAGPPLALYYDEEYREQDVDVEAVVPIGDAEVKVDLGRTKVRELPPQEEMASLVRPGPYDDFSPAYQTLMEWIQANGYRVIGPNREIYLRGPGEGVEPATYVTELQFPVMKN